MGRVTYRTLYLVLVTLTYLWCVCDNTQTASHYPVFCKLLVFWDSSGASIGTACQGRSGRGTEIHRKGMGGGTEGECGI